MTRENSDCQAAVIWCPFPTKASARDAAKQLLAQGDIACANILPNVESLFHYEGEMASDTEVGVLFKTTAEQLNAAIVRLGQLHPYDTPAIVGWCCDAASPKTLDWLNSTIGSA